MMSRYLAGVGTKRQRTVSSGVASGAGLCSLALFTAALLAGFAAAPVNAQQGDPQPSQVETTPPPATAQPTPPPGPLVAYENGQLTIVAENATLGEVMTALHNIMGTEVEVPAGSSGERVWAHLGPGSAHKVLSSLFANTDLDYILQGSATDPNGIRMVTLSVRSQDAKSGPAGEERASGPRGPHYVPNLASTPEPVEPAPAPAAQEASAASASAAPASAAPATPAAAGDSTVAASASSTPEVATPAPVQAGMEPTGPPNVFPQTPQPSAAGFNPHPSAPATMTTDQVVQQLSNMYQQRRLMQTGQASSTPN
jgi:hypothetical protein